MAAGDDQTLDVPAVTRGGQSRSTSPTLVYYWARRANQPPIVTPVPSASPTGWIPER